MTTTTTDLPRDERTAYRLTMADLDALAGRQVSDEDAARFVKALEHSSLTEVIEEVAFLTLPQVDATPWGAEDLAGCVADGEHHPWTRHPKAECPTMGEPDVVLGCDDCGSVDVEQGTALCKACRKARAGHPLTLVQDSKYAHLFRGECGCGWSTTGYVKAAMADSWHDRHVADRQVLAGV